MSNREAQGCILLLTRNSYINIAAVQTGNEGTWRHVLFSVMKLFNGKTSIIFSYEMKQWGGRYETSYEMKQWLDRYTFNFVKKLWGDRNYFLLCYEAMGKYV